MFVDRLESVLKEKGIKKSKFLSDLNMGKNQFSFWAKNNNPTMSTVLSISKYLGVSVDYLLEREEPGEPTKGFFPIPTGVESFRVIGKVRAGYDGAAVEIETDEICPIPTSLLRGHKKDDFFVLRVEGDSMYPRILDGDMILVERTEAVDSGTVAVILYDGEDATVKKVKYMPGEDWLELIPENPAYEIRRIEGHDLARCRILGRVCQLIRYI